MSTATVGASTSGSVDDGLTATGGVTTDPLLLDVPPSDPGTSTGLPPEICTLPGRSNALVTATTELGDVSMEAAVFAHAGGGKCPESYRVVLAADLDALTEVVADWAIWGPWPVGSLMMNLDIPPGAGPGPWQTSAQLTFDGGTIYFEGFAEVTEVTGFDDPFPVIEASFSLEPFNGEGLLEGSFRAEYCSDVAGGACGA